MARERNWDFREEVAGRFGRGGAVVVIAFVLVAIVVLDILFTSFYQLDEKKGEQGVVQRFGAYVRTETKSGVCTKLPWPFETVSVVSISEIHRIEIGFRSAGGGSPGYVPEAEHSICITKDQNLVNAEFIVQYAIADPKSYLFNVAGPERIISQVSKAVMRNIIANINIDDVLISDRTPLQDRGRHEIQEILDDYGVGVRIGAVQFQDVHAPKEVVDAFSDVQRGREDSETLMSEGERYYNAKVPVAEGQAAKMIAEAEAYKVERVNHAEGDAKRYLSIYERYKSEPELVRRQLYLQCMEEILPKLDVLIVDKEAGVNLFIDEKGKGR